MTHQEEFLSIPEQENIVSTLELFRNNYLCQYGEIIEHLCHKLEFTESNDEKDRLIRNIHNLMSLFTKSHIENIQYADLNKWECFFNVFKIPISVDHVKITNLDYHNKFFLLTSKIRYTYTIDEENHVESDLQEYLLGLGYEQFQDGNQTKIGYEFTYEIPYSFEEQIWFQAKYLLNYNMFILWDNICEFKRLSNENLPGYYEKDKIIPTILKKIIKNLFLLRYRNFPIDIKFKFSPKTLSRKEVDIIYNKYIFSRIRTIEKRLRSYMHLRYALSKIQEKNKLM